MSVSTSRFANVWSKIKQIMSNFHPLEVSEKRDTTSSGWKFKLLNPLTAKLFNLNFHSLEVVSH